MRERGIGMVFTEKEVMEALKKEWALVEGITDMRPEYCEHFVGEFQAMARFAERLTGRRYTATEDGVVEY